MISIISINGSHLVCEMAYTKDTKEYEEALMQIAFLGITYQKSSWDSRQKTITYWSHR